MRELRSNRSASLAFLLSILLARGAIAQAPSLPADLPPNVPANPLLESRSALYAQPYISPRTGWQVRFITAYYNAVEVSQSPPPFPRQMLFDAEVLQGDLWITRDISRHVFLLGNLPLRGGYSGFLDQALVWYHKVTGLSVPARDQLPRNVFQWGFVLPDSNIDRQRPGTFLGDLRTGAGVRLGAAELVATLTLPTATLGSDGWTRHVPGISLAIIGALVRNSRFTVDASASAGFTPTHGRLAKYQRSAFTSGALSGRWRFAGQQAVYGTFWIQSSNWKGTGFSGIDGDDQTLDYGFLLRLKHRWPELQLGMTEDLKPSGPALDVSFIIGLRW